MSANNPGQSAPNDPGLLPGFNVAGIADGQLLQYQAATKSFIPGSQAAGAQTGIANVFTAAQTVGAQIIQTDASGNKLFTATPTSTGTGTVAGQVIFYGSNSTDATDRAWYIGVDVAAAVPYRDMVLLGRLSSVGSGTYDFVYAGYNNGNGAAYLGVGLVPPRTDYALSVSGNDTLDTTQGGIAIRVSTLLTTGVPLALIDSATGNKGIWIDKNYGLNSDGTIANGLIVKAQVAAYPKRVLAFQDPAGSNTYGYLINSDGSCTFENIGLGHDLIDYNATSVVVNVQGASYPKTSLVLKDGGAPSAYGFIHESDGTCRIANITNGKNVIAIGVNQIGFFDGNAPVSQQTGTGVTLGFVAATGTAVLSGSTFTGNIGTTTYTIGDIVAALKQYNLLTR